jgi:hypothetical protein
MATVAAEDAGVAVIPDFDLWLIVALHHLRREIPQT